jgi:hypothetical protein
MSIEGPLINPLTGLRSGVLSIGVKHPFLAGVGLPLIASKLNNVFKLLTWLTTSAVGSVGFFSYCISSSEDDEDP